MIRSLFWSLCNRPELNPTILSDFDFKVRHDRHQLTPCRSRHLRGPFRSTQPLRVYCPVSYLEFDADSDGTSLAFQLPRVPEIQPICSAKSSLLLSLCLSLSLSLSDRPLQRLLRCPSNSHVLIRSLSWSLCSQPDLHPTILSDFDFKVRLDHDSLTPCRSRLLIVDFDLLSPFSLTPLSYPEFDADHDGTTLAV